MSSEIILALIVMIPLALGQIAQIILASRGHTVALQAASDATKAVEAAAKVADKSLEKQDHIIDLTNNNFSMATAEIASLQKRLDAMVIERHDQEQARAERAEVRVVNAEQRAVTAEAATAATAATAEPVPVPLEVAIVSGPTPEPEPTKKVTRK